MTDEAKVSEIVVEKENELDELHQSLFVHVRGDDDDDDPADGDDEREDEDAEAEEEEEEEEDDDSIAPDEDAADEEEVNSLVKESQMSLEDLLSTYGVPASAMSTVSAAETATRSSRSRTGRTAIRRPTAVLDVEEKETTDQVSDSSGPCPTKRSRRSNHTPLATPTNASSSPAPSSPQKIDSVAEVIPPVNSMKDHTITRDPTEPTPVGCVKSRRPKSESQMSHSPEPSISVTTSSSSSVNIQPELRSASPSTVPTHPSASISQNSPLKFPSSPVEGRSDEVETDGEVGGDVGAGSHEEGFSTARFWQSTMDNKTSPGSYNSDDDEDYAPSVESGHDWRGEIRVGEEYQAQVCPYILSRNCETSESKDDGFNGSSNDAWSDEPGHRWDDDASTSRLWQPGKLAESDVIHFERLFAQTFLFPLPNERTVDDEEALFLLMRCNYDTDETLQRLRFRTVPPAEIPGYMDTWSEADSAAFEKGFALYNKNFRQIRDTRLRHKTVGELVHYYYLWKKTARHDEFSRMYRRDKRKSPHPSITDFMDCLVLEQESAVESMSYHLNNNVGFPSAYGQTNANNNKQPLSSRHGPSIGAVPHTLPSPQPIGCSNGPPRSIMENHLSFTENHSVLSGPVEVDTSRNGSA